MECGLPTSQPWSIPTTQRFYPVNEAALWPVDLLRLQAEREILENGLANCVTYLHALRRKVARTERRLCAEPSLPHKKRKKMQQGKRELEKEIKNRERDEQALLNNLQACQTNIYIAETTSPLSTTLSSMVPDLASRSTPGSCPEESEPTELSWNGWTDETVVSPFQKHSSSSFFADDVDPNDSTPIRNMNKAMDDDNRHTLSIVPCMEDMKDTLPVPPNTARSHFLLSPDAAVFEPYGAYSGQGAILGQQLADLHLSSSLAISALKTKALALMEMRRHTDAGIVQVRRPSSLKKIVEESGSHTWGFTTPQQSPHKDTEGGKLKRSRTNSL
ncbi:hypothetical protein BDW02DRAFT_71186 [Decorospora gaudefroyi]|uniref:Uncharacterized protein n=1 Tax=Decorospora gaudefroyi TaxID=184978 RepID=A0A6A5K9H6_9PLEO|nr:hypothetical protein BDW02DRAFT_71186 [Decorospora gaudefroyi]